MPRYKTNSGKSRLVFMSNELDAALSLESESCGKSPSWVVRQSVLEYLIGKGYTFTENANPPGRGFRTDLSAKRPIIPETSKRRKKIEKSV